MDHITMADSIGIGWRNESYWGGDFDHIRVAACVGILSLLQLPRPRSFVFNKYDKWQAEDVGLTNCIVKDDCTIGGHGVFRGTSYRDIPETIKTSSGQYLIVEEYIDAQYHGSVQIHLLGGKGHLYIDECIVEDGSFRGFKLPPTWHATITANVRIYAERVVDYLLHMDIKNGIFGLDYMINKDGHILFHDFNPRKTGVSYVLDFVRAIVGGSLNGDCMSLTNRILDLGLHNNNKRFGEIKDALYGSGVLVENRNIMEGILIFNPKLLQCGLLNLVAVSRRRENNAYVKTAQQALQI